MKLNWRMYKQFAEIAWSETIAYRLNFFLSRVRYILAVILLFFVWQSVGTTQKTVGTFTTNEIITYTVGLLVVRALVFGYQSRRVAADINNGTLSTYLLKPAEYLGFMFIKECTQKFVSLISSIVELTILLFIFPIPFTAPPVAVWLQVAVIIFLAHIMYFCLSTTFSLIAFWSKEAFGPRFLFEWFLEFAAGAYIPIALFPGPVRTLFEHLPFVHFVSTPLLVFLQKITPSPALWFELLAWCVFFAGAMLMVWQIGLRQYRAEGL